MKYLAIDLGSKTLGLATGSGMIAKPWKTLRFKAHCYQKACNLLLQEIKQYQPDLIVLGYPVNMDGRVGTRAVITLKFQALLQENGITQPIILVDERLTTNQAQATLAIADLSWNKRQNLKDQIAAAFILQSYFDQLKRERKD